MNAVPGWYYWTLKEDGDVEYERIKGKFLFKIVYGDEEDNNIYRYVAEAPADFELDSDYEDYGIKVLR